MRLRVVTWNIRLGVESSLDRVAATLADLAPDIVALQEVGCGWVMGAPGDQAAAVAARCGLPHARFVPALWTEPSGDLRGLGQRLWPLEEAVAAGHDPAKVPRYGVALLSRFPVGPVRRTPLPRERDEPRVLGDVTLTSPAGPLRVLFTHLALPAPERLRQAEAIAGALRGGNVPALLLGDLNDAEDAAPLRVLTRLADDPGAGAGEDGWTYPAEAPRQRIDYILTRGRWRVVAPPRPVPCRASDHRPVLAVLELGEPSALTARGRVGAS